MYLSSSNVSQSSQCLTTGTRYFSATFIASSLSSSVAANADNLFDIYLYAEALVPILLVTSHPVNICETSNDEAVASSINSVLVYIVLFHQSHNISKVH